MNEALPHLAFFRRCFENVFENLFETFLKHWFENFVLKKSFEKYAI